ncbi:hypothetical protein ABFX02_13G150200 [Erythranthe guttata]
MHAKHQNGPGNGYRSNSMGGVAAASRIPPGGAVRGRRMYNSEYRSFSRGGYGAGGHSKQLQPPPPPSKDSNVFVEAGRLAAEYLVSKGVLPSNALSGKWQNDSRASAHSRLGNPAPDVGPGKRRYSDEYSSMGSRSFTRGRKRTGDFKNYGSEVNRELGRSVSLSETIRASPAMEADSNGEIRNLSPGEITQEVHGEVHVESGLKKSTLLEDAGAIASNLTKEKNLPSAVDADDPNKFNDEAEMVKDRRNDNDLQQKHDETKVREDHTDLLKHCKFVNVPTKARSSLTVKGSKGEKDPMNENVDFSKKQHLESSGVHVLDVDVKTDEFKSLELEKSPKVFPDVYKEQQAEEGLSGFGSSNSVVMDRVQKRAIDYSIDDKEDFKKLKQWVPQPEAQFHSPLPRTSSMGNQPMLQEPSTSQKSFDITLFPKDHADSSEFMEEKQLFPGSFKTCDLNLVGTSDVSENHEADPMLVFPSNTQTGKIATHIDVDLSISSNINLPNKNGKHGVHDIDIEVIDLEKDFVQDNTFSNPGRRGDIVFTDLDGFANNVSADGISDAQDGYGLMISEFLGNVSPNCTVPTDLNSLHNHIGLPNAEGILGEDDSIYMSLGEIPTSLLGAWGQPTQDYGKPF